MSCNLENNQPPVEWHATLITSTKGTAIIIVGFNCRPLAERCTMAGFRPVVIDYFGDADIRQHAAEGHYFLQESQDPRDGDHFRSWALATLERVVSKQPGPGKPMILAGSGFDDEPSCWKRFNELGFLLGNSAMAVQRARNLVAIGSLLKNNGIGIEIPRTTRVSITPDTGVDGLVQEICKKLKFPIVMKQTRTAGGSGIEFMENEASLSKFLAKASDENSGDAGDAKVYNAQEFVGDGDARDISVIACNDRVVCKTRQIIGEARLHAPKRFSYCGNEIPLEPLSPAQDGAIGKLVVALSGQAGLKGIYGIDFVHKKTRLYFMEINPRIPGSMEPACLALDGNLIIDHVKSFMRGQERRSIEGRVYVPKYHAIKFILFADRDFSMPRLDNLRLEGELRDITPPGTRLVAGMPVLTYLQRGPPDNLANRNNAIINVEKIYARLHGEEIKQVR